MLVLSRKPKESIIVGGDIRITVLEIRGSHIRLGVEAPKHIRVLREELIMRDEPALQPVAECQATPPALGPPLRRVNTNQAALLTSGPC